MKAYLRHKEQGTSYQVIRVDPKETKDRKMVLRGAHGEFTEPFDPERFKKMGYELVKEEDA